MQVTAFEGVVENDVIKLQYNLRLPNKTKVYVIVPDLEPKHASRIYSPRLVHPEHAKDFQIEMIEAPADASI